MCRRCESSAMNRQSTTQYETLLCWKEKERKGIDNDYLYAIVSIFAAAAFSGFAATTAVVAAG